MNLVALGCDFRSAPVAVRERLAFPEAKIERALDELTARFECEAVVVSTCNRVELYLARPQAECALNCGPIAEFLSEFHGLDCAALQAHLIERRDADAVRHLFRVAASLESMVVGEAQIAGQLKRAYEAARLRSAAGPVLNALFQATFGVAKRVRHETGIAHGRVSVSSVAVDYVREVFTRFDDKTVLIIGAGKMGGLTLRHLQRLKPQRVLVTNRSPEKAQSLAAECAGTAVPWEQLDDACVQADIILSTTGAEPTLMPRRRWNAILARRSSGTAVVIDIAIPRDFDPRIHDGDRTCVFNIDDLKSIQEKTVAERRKHIGPAEAIVEQEVRKFLKEWARRGHGPAIARLTQHMTAQREAIVADVLRKLNGRLTDADKQHIEQAFHLLQNRFLHGPISALGEAAHAGHGDPLVEALRKLFRLPE